MTSVREMPRIAAAMIMALLGGCSAVDSFGYRADIYNYTVKDSKTRLLLANVVHAAYEEPLQWSSISQVSGTASVSAGLSGKVPIIGHQGTSSLFYEIDPSVSASGGPTFTVPILDTKEFQSGIQTQISERLLANFVAQGYSLDFLLPLVVSQITIGAAKDRTFRITSFEVSDLHNNDDPLAGNTVLNGALHQLVAHGLTIAGGDPTPIGPIFPIRSLKDLKALTDAVGSSVTLRQYDSTKGEDEDLTANDRALLAKSGSTQYVRALRPAGYRFCFNANAPRDSPVNIPPQNGPISFLEKVPAEDFRSNTIYLLVQGDKLEPNLQTGIMIPPKLYCNNRGKPTGGADSVLDLKLRSVEGIVRFLGAITRAETSPAFEEKLPTPIPFWSGAAGTPATLFTTRGNAAGRQSVSVTRGDRTYAVSLGDYPQDQSGKVLSFLLEAINLSNSAKDLPSPSIISVIAH